MEAIESGRAPASRVSRVATFILIVVLATGCGKAPRAPEVVPAPPPPEVPPPSWLSAPSQHPEFPPDRFDCALGSSMMAMAEAEEMAIRSVTGDLRLRVKSALQELLEHDRTRPRSKTFLEAIDRAIDRGLGELGFRVHTTPTAQFSHRGRSYALACLDRRETREHLQRRNEATSRKLFERELEALAIAGEADWFGFSRVAGALFAERAENLVLEAEIRALDGPEPVRVQQPSLGMPALKAVADSLRQWTGWTLHFDFDWTGPPPPPHFALRLKERILRVLLDEGLRVGLGQGCPRAPGESETEEPLAHPGNHYVLDVRVSGTGTRVGVASWDVDYELHLGVRRCGGGAEVPARLIGRIAMAGERDPGTAYLKSLSGGRVDSLVVGSLRELDLIFPEEFSPYPPGR